VSAGVITAGLVLTVVLMRRDAPVDVIPGAPVLATPTPRPAPRTAG